MIEYTFSELNPTKKVIGNYEQWLFHYPDHLLLQSPSGWHSFYVINKVKQRVEAHLHIHIENGLAQSPYRASFGSIQFSKELKPIALYNFIEYILARLKEIGVTELLLKNPPDLYQEEQAPLLNTFFINLGFTVENAEVGALIDLDENFHSKINPWEGRKLKQCYKAGLTFNQIDRPGLKKIYDFILECRKERDYSLSINWDNIEKTVNTFPDRFFLFTASLQNEMVAASISINVGNKILYNFHSAHPRKHDALSPVVFLMEGIYSFGKNNGFNLLDLGTSALDKKPNFSLLDFKLALGAIPSIKLTFRKKL